MLLNSRFKHASADRLSWRRHTILPTQPTWSVEPRAPWKRPVPIFSTQLKSKRSSRVVWRSDLFSSKLPASQPPVASPCSWISLTCLHSMAAILLLSFFAMYVVAFLNRTCRTSFLISLCFHELCANSFHCFHFLTFLYFVDIIFFSFSNWLKISALVKLSFFTPAPLVVEPSVPVSHPQNISAYFWLAWMLRLPVPRPPSASPVLVEAAWRSGLLRMGSQPVSHHSVRAQKR